MNENIALAIKLMFVGMVTIFVILATVILLGRLIIWITNRIDPAESSNEIVIEAIEPNHKAAIERAIQMISNGQKIVTSIQRK